MESTPPAKRHDNLWLSDGNVVLGTNAYLFKVHKSVLSMQSSVFRDMFALPTAGDTIDDSGDAGIAGIAPELYEGLHFVSLLDDGRDVEHILRAVYERSYYDPHFNDAPLDLFIALLRLSFKYDFGDIRRDVLGQLSRFYPTSREEYKSAGANHRGMLGKQRWICHAPLLKVCVEVGIDDCFPNLYYAVSKQSASSTFGFFSDTTSSLPILRRIFTGLEELKLRIETVTVSIIGKTERCIIRHNARKDDGKIFSIADFVEFVDVLCLDRVMADRLVLDDSVRLCPDCVEEIWRSFEADQNAIWNRLPSIFGFDKTWDDIRAELLDR